MTAHVNSECPGSKPPLQEAGPILGCSQKIISEAQEPPYPAQAPVIGQPGPARACSPTRATDGLSSVVWWPQPVHPEPCCLEGTAKCLPRKTDD